MLVCRRRTLIRPPAVHRWTTPEATTCGIVSPDPGCTCGLLPAAAGCRPRGVGSRHRPAPHTAGGSGRQRRAPHPGQAVAHPGARAHARPRDRGMALGGLRESALQVGAPRVVTGDQGHADRDGLLPAGGRAAPAEPAAGPGLGPAAHGSAAGRPAAGLREVRRHRGARGPARVAAASAVARGAPAARGDRRVRHAAAAPPRRHVGGRTAVGRGVAAGQARRRAARGAPGPRCTGGPRSPRHPRGTVATPGAPPGAWSGCGWARALRRRPR
jgi:hypothetical protein